MSPPRRDSSEIDPVLELLGLEAIVDELPSELSQGQRKLVGIGRALAARPRIVCLDEPAAGLDTHESEELGRRLRGLVDAGQSMLLVDHDMGLVLGICDEVVVLEFGRVIARGAGRRRAPRPAGDHRLPRQRGRGARAGAERGRPWLTPFSRSRA